VFVDPLVVAGPENLHTLYTVYCTVISRHYSHRSIDISQYMHTAFQFLSAMYGVFRLNCWTA
jgi:hypothetical protein